MKLFLKRIFTFSLVGVIISFNLFVIFNYKVNNISLDESKIIIIAGDSHTQHALNDSIIENSINISNPGEHFLYTYNILNRLLISNDHIQQVILGVSFHSFSSFQDEKIKEPDKTIRFFPKYYPILNYKSLKDVSFIKKNEIHGVIKHVLSVIFSSKINKYPFIGGYSKTDSNNLSEAIINRSIERHYFTDLGKQQHYSDYQKEYLEKVVELCQDKGIQLIFINTPIHNNYYKKIPDKFIANYYLTISNLGSNNNRFIDLHSLKLDEKFYIDGDHTNSFGARKTSLVVNKMINK